MSIDFFCREIFFYFRGEEEISNKCINNQLVSAAVGKVKFDTVIKNTRLVNVDICEILDAVIGIKNGYIAFVGYSNEELDAIEYIDAEGRYAVPGLIDAHMHIESTMATPAAFAKGVLPHGTTSIVADPHEIANIFGADGVKMILDASENLPMNVNMMIPSTVPSSEGMETAGASIDANDVSNLLTHERIIGLGEVMDFWGVVNQDEKITNIINEARRKKTIIEGHTPVFKGKELQAFVAAGIDSDHTIMDKDIIREKLRSGMCVQIQSRFITKELMEYINTLENFSNVLLVTDDVSANRLKKEGHLDALIRKAISYGLDPIKAVRATTINAARRMRLYEYGSISAGRKADILLLDSLEEFKIDTVITNGKIAVKNNKILVDIEKSQFPEYAYDSVKMNKLTVSDFDIKTKHKSGTANVNTIVVNSAGSYTVKEQNNIQISDGLLDLMDEDIFYMAVFERHGISGSKNVGLIKGIGSFKGAVATTYSHDCHNLVVIGRDKADMVLAANTLINAGGGMCSVMNGEVLSMVELPVGGILSDKSITDISNDIDNQAKVMVSMGIEHSEPIMLLTILALAVSPEIKITDLGIVDVLKKEFIELINYEESSDE